MMFVNVKFSLFYKKREMKNESLQRTIVLVVIIVILIIVVLIVVFRFEVFKTGKQLPKLSEEELQKKGYGTYSTVYQTGCLTASGKCATAGVQYITKYCVPNPDTGKGCLDEDGVMTFASQTLTQPCLPNCRKYVLSDVSNSTTYTINNICAYNAPYNDPSYKCIPSNARTSKYSIYYCKPNDNVGDNGCSYICGTDGLTNENVSGDSVPTLPSYIPACVGNKGKVITLNSLGTNQVDPLQLPSDGFNLSKGFNVKNIKYKGQDSSLQNMEYNLYYGPTGAVNPNWFEISPPYYFPKDALTIGNTGYSYVTPTELAELDNTLIVYENCVLDPANTKPFCGNNYVYPPITIASNKTYNQTPLPPVTTQHVNQTPNCYPNPYWNSGPVAPYNTNYINPYTGTSGATGFNMTLGIGTFGITYEAMTCLTSFPTLQNVPTSIGPTGSYYIPTSSSICASYTGSSNTGPSATTCYTDKNYVPNTLQNNLPYTICNTVFPDGTAVTPANGYSTAPGVIVPCQYMPPNELINFSALGNGGTGLNANLRNMIGNFVQLTATYSSDDYLLSSLSSPCSAGTNVSNISPLTNCTPFNSDLSSGYDIQPCMFIKTFGSNANINWGKQGCDEEMIKLTSSLNLVISPRTLLYNSAIICDIYAYFGGVFGRLIYQTVGSDQQLQFQPLTKAQRINPSSYTPSALFRLDCDATTGNVVIQTAGGLDVKVNTYDGVTYSQNNFIIGKTGSQNVTLKYRALPFDGPIYKTSGLYIGDNVNDIVNTQRLNPCYYSTCNPDLSSPPCFPKTCNLYYEYNPEICQ